MARGDIRTHRAADGSMTAPSGIIVTPDGLVWFTSIGNDRIGCVDPSTGAIRTFADPADAMRLPANIFPGADGRMWFTCLGSPRIGAIEGGFSFYGAAPEVNGPFDIKGGGGDGLLWFINKKGDTIGAISAQ